MSRQLYVVRLNIQLKYLASMIPRATRAVKGEFPPCLQRFRHHLDTTLESTLEDSEDDLLNSGRLQEELDIDSRIKAKQLSESKEE